MNLSDEFAQFNESLDLNESADAQDTSIPEYVEALNKRANEILGLNGDDEYVSLRPVYLHGTKVHSLIFDVCKQGKRYSARLIRRVSLGLRDKAGERWSDIIKQAYEVAMERKPVGLDPKLADLPLCVGHTKNYQRMTFAKGDTEVLVSHIGIVKASGDPEDMTEILTELKKRGL
jgi:hypothetical protein